MAADSPALTEQGQAVLQTGEAADFEAHAAFTASHEAAARAREERHQLREQEREAKTALRAARVLAGEACSIDETGILHGAGALGLPRMPGDSASAEHQKQYHRRRHQREEASRHGEHHHADFCVDEEGHVHDGHEEGTDEHPSMCGKVSIGPDGKVHEAPQPHTPSKAEQLKLFHKKHAVRSHAHEEGEPDLANVVDVDGTVQGTTRLVHEPLIEPAVPGANVA